MDMQRVELKGKEGMKRRKKEIKQIRWWFEREGRREKRKRRRGKYLD